MGKKRVLNILIICRIFLNINAISQEVNGVDNMYKKELENHTWETDKIVLLCDTEEYVLKKFVARKFAGNLLSFNNEDDTFISRYISFCGNDKMIRSLKGKYKFEDKDKISFVPDTFKTKSNPKIQSKIIGKKILFQIIKKDEKFILKKIE